MNGVHRRIVVLRDIHSNLIEEAILVLKTEPDSENGKQKQGESRNLERDKDFILKEAKTIINNYIENTRQLENKVMEKRKKKRTVKSQFITNLIINFALMGSILLLALFVSRLI